MKARLSFLGMALLLVPLVCVGALNKSTEKFPHRGKYDVKVIDTSPLRASWARVVVVDVRSKYEYQTLRIKTAINIPLSGNPKFADQVRGLVNNNPRKQIVFYCNGTTCLKSYDAATLCESLRIPNTVAYDAGIFEWAQTYPELSVLRGRTPRPEDLISDQEFKKHLLPPEEFKAQVEQHAGTQALVLDIRDRTQRQVLLWPMREVRAELDNQPKLDEIVGRAKRENKTLLVYDAAGHQVRWFQYYLKEKGVASYRFMLGGAQAYEQRETQAKASVK